MESMYTDELRAQINLLMANLESLPVSKSVPMLKRYPRYCKYVQIEEIYWNKLEYLNKSNVSKHLSFKRKPYTLVLLKQYL